MKKELTLKNLIALIRELHRISDKKAINESTLIEEELGITGDDGCELLEEIESNFDLSFSGKDSSLREFFDLEDNQYLFHSEGFSLTGIFQFILGGKSENVKRITVGDLYSGATKAKQRGTNR